MEILQLVAVGDTGDVLLDDGPVTEYLACSHSKIAITASAGPEEAF
jgi:hypothetical protein